MAKTYTYEERRVILDKLYPDYLAAVELEYRIHDFVISPGLPGNIFYNGIVNLKKGDLPFLSQTMLKSPVLSSLNIDIDALTEDFVSKSIILPDWVSIDIRLGEDEYPDYSMLGKFQAITNLDMVYNEEVGIQLAKLKNLKVLYLDMQGSDKIPEFIFHLDLTHLSLLDINIEVLPKEIANLKNLQYIKLIGDPTLQDITSLASLNKLKTVFIVDWDIKIPEGWDLYNLQAPFSIDKPELSEFLVALM